MTRSIHYSDYLDLTQVDSSIVLFQPIPGNESERRISDQEIDRVTELYSKHCSHLLKEPLVTPKQVAKAFIAVAMLAGVIALAILFPHDLLIGAATLGSIYFASHAYSAYSDLNERRENKKSAYLKFVVQNAADPEFRKQIKTGEEGRSIRPRSYHYTNDSEHAFSIISDFVESKFKATFKATFTSLRQRELIEVKKELDETRKQQSGKPKFQAKPIKQKPEEQEAEQKFDAEHTHDFEAEHTHDTDQSQTDKSDEAFSSFISKNYFNADPIQSLENYSTYIADLNGSTSVSITEGYEAPLILNNGEKMVMAVTYTINKTYQIFEASSNSDQFAIKIGKEEFKTPLIEEFKIAQTLNHSNIIKIDPNVDPEKQKPKPLLKLEKIDGATLHQHLLKEINFSEARKLGFQLLSATSHLIEKDILPLDLLNLQTIYVNNLGDMKIVNLAPFFNISTSINESLSFEPFLASLSNILGALVQIMKHHKDTMKTQNESLYNRIYNADQWTPCVRPSLIKYPPLADAQVTLPNSVAEKKSYVLKFLEEVQTDISKLI